MNEGGIPIQKMEVSTSIAAKLINRDVDTVLWHVQQGHLPSSKRSSDARQAPWLHSRDEILKLKSDASNP